VGVCSSILCFVQNTIGRELARDCLVGVRLVFGWGRLHEPTLVAVAAAAAAAAAVVPAGGRE
jgi:hypothetical protein